MEKVLVGIHATAANVKYDSFIPGDMPISQLTTILANGISELTDGKYKSSGREMLSLKESTLPFNPNLTLDDYQVKNGMQLYLV